MSTQDPQPRTIVIAWTTTELEWDGEPYAKDLGAPARLASVTTAHAMVWLNSGTDADQAKARAHAKTIGHATVMTFPTTYRDPLGAARELVMDIVS